MFQRPSASPHLKLIFKDEWSHLHDEKCSQTMVTKLLRFQYIWPLTKNYWSHVCLFISQEGSLLFYFTQKKCFLHGPLPTTLWEWLDYHFKHTPDPNLCSRLCRRINLISILCAVTGYMCIWKTKKKKRKSHNPLKHELDNVMWRSDSSVCSSAAWQKPL